MPYTPKAHEDFQCWTFNPWGGSRGPTTTGKEYCVKTFYVTWSISYESYDVMQSFRLYNIDYITLKDASHGHWYYNGDEFDGIFKGQFDSEISKAWNKK